MPHENHQLLDLLNDEAEFIRTKRGGLKKKYNTEKVYLYELAWLPENHPYLSEDHVEIIESKSESVFVKRRTRLATTATRILQTTPSGEVATDLTPQLYTEKPTKQRRLSNFDGYVRSYNCKRNW